jgi:predicted ester cyclase
MTRDEILALFERRRQAFDNLDAAALATDYADTAEIESPVAGLHQGPAAAERALRAVFTAFLDLKVDSEPPLVDVDGQVAQAMTLSGTHIGSLFGIEPTGKMFRLSAVFLYRLKDGKITRERRVYDFTGLLLQVGALKAKPL